ncbi:unnamed protein product [Dovyalis caffra]|uniref:Leucine-rich repeat-containing N-terminal plant-type domain-containing protein n=1 Tax=Dovyalis caffra TaxID=77055 RepID=A0AAV1RWN1_9ROSI|nr:unnamed protein product [Dovyalis caffra]
MVVGLVLINHCCSSCYGCWEEERIALLHLKAFFSYPDGPSLFNWSEKQREADCCKWTDILECDTTTKRVIGLSLGSSMDRSMRNRYLNASLFLPFKELKSLTLADSNFVGCFQNQGFQVLSPRLRNLEVLDLSFIKFNGSILLSLSGFSSLKSFYLTANMLTGSTRINGKVSCGLKKLPL